MARTVLRQNEDRVMEQNLQSEEQSYVLAIPDPSSVPKEPDYHVQYFPNESMIRTAFLTLENGSNVTPAVAVPVPIQQQRPTVIVRAPAAKPSTSANARAAIKTVVSVNTGSTSQEVDRRAMPPPPQASISRRGRKRAAAPGSRQTRAVVESERNSILRNALTKPKRAPRPRCVNPVLVYHPPRFMDNPRDILMATPYGKRLAEAKKRLEPEPRPPSPPVPTNCWICALLCPSKDNLKKHFRMQHIRIIEQTKLIHPRCLCVSCRDRLKFLTKEEILDGHYLDPERRLRPEEMQVDPLDLSIISI